MISQINRKDLDFRRCDLRGLNLVGTNLRNALFEDALMLRVDLTNADLTGADLTNVRLDNSILCRTNLTNVDLTSANLAGADLTGAVLTNVIGLGTKQDEIRFANHLLGLLDNRLGFLSTEAWHSCTTVHSIEGWACLDEAYPSAKASRMYPTLARCFDYRSSAEIMSVLRKVASGELSVFPD